MLIDLSITKEEREKDSGLLCFATPNPFADAKRVLEAI
jgi:hypothetical protein